MKKIHALAAAALAFGAVTFGTAAPASAQEIQLTGPLAGAPAVRKLRLYREGRVELAIGPGFTLLDEYRRTVFAAGRLQYNLTDWLGIGVFGGFGAWTPETDLSEKINTNAIRNSRTAANLAPAEGQPGGQKFEEQTGKITWMAAPQLTISPFRGKLALFQSIFVDTDLYIHGGAAFVGLEERGECGGDGMKCSDPASFARTSRVGVAPTFGLGLTLYTGGLISINAEYRAMPFSWNRSGFDTRGTGNDASFPDNKINSEDQTFKFNQMIFVAVGFHLPSSPKTSD